MTEEKIDVASTEEVERPNDFEQVGVDVMLAGASATAMEQVDPVEQVDPPRPKEASNQVDDMMAGGFPVTVMEQVVESRTKDDLEQKVDAGAPASKEVKKKLMFAKSWYEISEEAGEANDLFSQVGLWFQILLVLGVDN